MRYQHRPRPGEVQDGRAGFFRRAARAAHSHNDLPALRPTGRIRARLDRTTQKEPATPRSRRPRSRPLRQGLKLHGPPRRPRRLQKRPLPQTLRGRRNPVGSVSLARLPKSCHSDRTLSEVKGGGGICFSTDTFKTLSFRPERSGVEESASLPKCPPRPVLYE
jgi:hypothetical protein